MNNLLKDRIRLIKAIAAVSIGTGYQGLDRMIRDDKVEFLSVANFTEYQISYSRTLADKLNEKRRIITTLAKYLSKKYGFTVDKVFEKFISDVWTLMSDRYKPRIKYLVGEEITNYYKSNNESATRSCMTGPNANKVKLYALNPETIKMVIMDDELRALLWKTDDGVEVMDRIYPNGHWKVNLMTRWAHQQGYRTRHHNNNQTGKTIPLSDGSSRIVSVKITKRELFPYLDTFCYGTIDKTKSNVLKLSNDLSLMPDNLLFHQADGTVTHTAFCVKCDKMLTRPEYIYHDAVSNNIYCDHCINSKIR